MNISCGVPDCTVCKTFAFIPWEEIPTDHIFMELEDIPENIPDGWDVESMIDTLDYIEEIPTYDYDEEI